LAAKSSQGGWAAKAAHKHALNRHLHAALDESVAHYNQHRPHRARNLRPPDYDDVITRLVANLATARIGRHKILGGLTTSTNRQRGSHRPSHNVQVRDDDKVSEPYRLSHHGTYRNRHLEHGGFGLTVALDLDAPGIAPREAVDLTNRA
jgi:hypothetical protein